MRILSLDLGKYKSVACDYEAETGRHRFTTIPTNPQTLHDDRGSRTRPRSDRDLFDRWLGE